MKTRNEITFPARDEGLGSLIDRLSGPATGPHADNLISNEDSFPRVCGELSRRVRPGGVYLGVGPDQNLTYIAYTRPALAFVLDYRRRNLLLHLLHKAIFALSADRVHYLERLTARRAIGLVGEPNASKLVASFANVPIDRGRLDAAISEVAAVLRPLGILHDDEWAELATIQTRVAGPGLEARFLALRMYPTFGRMITTPDRDGHAAHFLATEATYQVVRECEIGERVIPLVADFARPNSLDKLGKWLRERHFSVDVFYTSDVEFFLLRSGKFPEYMANLGRLPWTENAVIVRTSTREIEHAERYRGDSSTTVVRDAAEFLEAARKGRIGTVDDLFR